MDWAKQLQDETRNTEVLRFGVAYIRGLTVVVTSLSWDHNADKLQVMNKAKCAMNSLMMMSIYITIIMIHDKVEHHRDPKDSYWKIYPHDEW